MRLFVDFCERSGTRLEYKFMAPPLNKVHIHNLKLKHRRRTQIEDIMEKEYYHLVDSSIECNTFVDLKSEIELSHSRIDR